MEGKFLHCTLTSIQQLILSQYTTIQVVGYNKLLLLYSGVTSESESDAVVV